ncbi:MAG: hypothetical protein ACJZ18_04425 [Methylophilaceae bacterium]|tara:strand:+ start:363 stop:731 length:369 start_codon:yes stop_codon:yes gene_type:complete
MKSIFRFIIVTTILFGFTINSIADQKRVFSEDEFLALFNGKPKSRVLKYLGEPDIKDIAIKPKGANSVVGSKIRMEKNSKKKDKIEMWYYKNVVEYAPKKTYLKVELTLINDRIVNVGFFNQ